jgi:hypothetical protein
MSASTFAYRLRSLVALGLLGLALNPIAQAAKPPQVTEDGLELTKAKGITLLYVRPGASLAGYTKVMLDPVEVAFSKDWDPKDYGYGRFGLSAGDVNKIRHDLGAMAHETFVKVLSEGGYPVAPAVDSGVLQVTAAIVNLYINAPGTMDSARSKTYVFNAGQMTLAIALRDAATGTVLVRAYDTKQATDTGQMHYSSGVFNRAEADYILRGWADRLKRALDAAKAK